MTESTKTVTAEATAKPTDAPQIDYKTAHEALARENVHLRQMVADKALANANLELQLRLLQK